MASLASSYLVKDRNRVIKHLHFQEGFPAAFPSEWFATNKNSKPPLKVTKIPLEVARNAILNGASRPIDSRVIVSYLVSIFQAATGTLTEAWTSYELSIGDAGDNIGIQNILNLQEQNDNPELATGRTTGAPGHDKWLPLYLCSLYRLSRISHDQYLADMKKRITLRLRANGMPSTFSLDTLLLEQKGWMESDDYCRLIAGIDMLLHHFPQHKYREVRLGTTVTRFQDCAAVQEVVMLAQGLGMEFPELATWICIDELADEMIKLCSVGQEIEEAGSYAPYFMSMKLASKSKYSVTDNPYMHLFANIVGCSRGHKRSKNAIMVGESATDKVLLNAAILAYASRNFGPLTRKITETGLADPMAEEEEEDLDPELSEEPEGRDSKEWIAYIRDNGGKLTPKMGKALKAAWKANVDIRQGTIGEWLKQQAASISAMVKDSRSKVQTVQPSRKPKSKRRGALTAAVSEFESSEESGEGEQESEESEEESDEPALEPQTKRSRRQ